jgi:hypothetical protein
VPLSLEGEVGIERARRFKANSFTAYDTVVDALTTAGTMTTAQVQDRRPRVASQPPRAIRADEGSGHGCHSARTTRVSAVTPACSTGRREWASSRLLHVCSTGLVWSKRCRNSETLFELALDLWAQRGSNPRPLVCKSAP